METNRSSSDANRAIEFSLRGTFQFSATPGRIERFLTRLFRERGPMTPTVTAPSDHEVTLPGSTRLVRRG
jgi:hypothetical protein